MIDYDKNVAWLKTLKVGSKVAVHRGSYGLKEFYFQTITAITPKGKITLEDGTKYRPDGHQITQDKWNWNTLCEPTQEVIAYEKRRRLVSNTRTALQSVTKEALDGCTDEELHKLYEMLDRIVDRHEKKLEARGGAEK